MSNTYHEFRLNATKHQPNIWLSSGSFCFNPPNLDNFSPENLGEWIFIYGRKHIPFERWLSWKNIISMFTNGFLFLISTTFSTLAENITQSIILQIYKHQWFQFMFCFFSLFFRLKHLQKLRISLGPPLFRAHP